MTLVSSIPGSEVPPTNEGGKRNEMARTEGRAEIRVAVASSRHHTSLRLHELCQHAVLLLHIFEMVAASVAWKKPSEIDANELLHALHLLRHCRNEPRIEITSPAY
eukprot:TRINITY_DN1649_c1_g2_i1.p2 TRINITY_DN1649_c1_g2~~TRINITY_DN1649_c1_g2_i1.p2  ORF type:complete len:106 (-),score=7.72 TRINITY_DN1649_c1_g2_i1:1703-2020(-)